MPEFNVRHLASRGCVSFCNMPVEGAGTVRLACG